MRKLFVILALVVAAGAALYFYNRETAATSGGERAAGPAGNRPGGPGGGAFARPPLTVELASVTRAPVSEQISLVGNLIGRATVDVVPKVNGRLQDISVRLGDPVRTGQAIARVEDREIREQVKQAEASFDVAAATVRQREADLKFAETNLERSRSLFDRQLLPRQTLDDAEARYQAAVAQLDLARAQFDQAKARLEELRITLGNTVITSPVDGFVGKRYLDPGAYASTNAPVASLVDISIVRLVVNLVERDLGRVRVGAPAETEVDAFPGETFVGRVARVAPVLDPATRTAEIEIEVPNPTGRLKPGMYARVRITVDQRQDALVVPRNALVVVEGRHGVFVPTAGDRQARFRPVEVGLQDQQRAEVKAGLQEGDRVITTGAAALHDGDPIALPGRSGGVDRAGVPNNTPDRPVPNGRNERARS